MQTVDTRDSRVPLFNDPAKRSLMYQVGVLLAVAVLAFYLVHNTLNNLERQAIATGFGFLEKESSFEIGETLIAYSAANTYARALTVGVLNTLKVSFIGIVLTVLLGTLIGIARLSANWLVSRLAAIYIEVFQDIPVLLQLFFLVRVFLRNAARAAPGPEPRCRPVFMQPRLDVRRSGRPRGMGLDGMGVCARLRGDLSAAALGAPASVQNR